MVETLVDSHFQERIVVLVLLKLDLLLGFGVFFFTRSVKFIAYPWSENRGLLLLVV